MQDTNGNNLTHILTTFVKAIRAKGKLLMFKNEKKMADELYWP
jgi:hypothetical protein